MLGTSSSDLQDASLSSSFVFSLCVSVADWTAVGPVMMRLDVRQHRKPDIIGCTPCVTSEYLLKSR